MSGEPVLSVRDLSVRFDTPEGTVNAVDGVSYDLYPGETLGVVGESGSGKSVSVMSMLGLVPSPPGRVAGGEVLFEGVDLLRLSKRKLRRIRGNDIAMVFQDPLSSLNPVFTVGWQLAEALTTHDRTLTDDAAKRRSIELLDLVGVPSPERRYSQYPHEFSGGMRQRAMVAMAIANQPKILIADEPTTALDVTIQAQVLEVLQEAKRRTQAATILITHDLGLVAEMADRVVVMYAGRVVESGDVHTIFHAPRHPYTLGLIRSLPSLTTEVARLATITGQPPSLIDLPPGCAFHPRCRLGAGRERCVREVPPHYELGNGHVAACHFHTDVDELAQELSAEEQAEGGTGRAR